MSSVTSYYGDPEVAFWSFFVFCMVVVSVTLFVLFYAHRLAAQIVFRLVSIYTWKRFRVSVECESFIFAPLSGRIFFRNLRIVTRDQTWAAFRGYLVLRYWISKSRGNEEEGLGIGNTPCRLGVYVEGIEWFIYNRTSVYWFIDELLVAEEDNSAQRTSSPGSGGEGGSPHRSDEKRQSFHRPWYLPLDAALRTERTRSVSGSGGRPIPWDLSDAP
ncbi:hypothetical protein DFJ74DRAFT_152875 [Hyaloraphidium curvatum]|nr:hypothetical protein DFJ74DRAFT_152875 [Hyaloraphidium curvatum]